MAAAERRASILKACIPVFAGRGFYGTTLRDLRSAAGVTQPTIYWYFRDKQALYGAVLDQQAQELVTGFLDATKPELLEPGDTTWLTKLGDLLLTWMEAGDTGLRLFLFSGLEQTGGSSALLRLHESLIRQVESRLAARNTDKVECALLAHCFVGLIFHFGLMRILEGEWPSGIACEQLVHMVVRMVLGDSGPRAACH